MKRKTDLELAFDSDIIIGDINSSEIKFIKNKVIDSHKIIQRGNTIYLVKKEK